MNSPIARHAILAILLAAALPCAVFAQSDGIDTQALETLKKATSFLAAQERFSVDTESTLQAVLTTGQKVEFDFVVTLAADRPDKLRAERTGDIVDQIFYYDGTSLTLFNPIEGYFATVAAPNTFGGMVDFARERLDLVLPAGDLISKDAFAILTEGVSTAFVVGEGVVEGVRCDHLAFRNSDNTDWQIWIQQGDEPLIRKMVITSTDIVGQPEFRVVMNSWDLEPSFPDGYFTFEAPTGAAAIDFLPVASVGESSE